MTHLFVAYFTYIIRALFSYFTKNSLDLSPFSRPIPPRVNLKAYIHFKSPKSLDLYVYIYIYIATFLKSCISALLLHRLNTVFFIFFYENSFFSHVFLFNPFPLYPQLFHYISLSPFDLILISTCPQHIAMKCVGYTNKTIKDNCFTQISNDQFPNLISSIPSHLIVYPHPKVFLDCPPPNPLTNLLFTAYEHPHYVLSCR